MGERETDASPAVVTVAVTDELDVATIPGLRRNVERALQLRPARVVIDLSACGFAGVDAIEELVRLTASARARGAALALTGLKPIVRRTVGLLGLEPRLVMEEPACVPADMA